MRLSSCLLIFFLLLHIVTIGQVKDYQFSRLDIQSGLSNNQVNCVFKDAKGYMWFGTLSGLNRYDGYGFKTFKHDDLDSATIIDDNISRLFEGPGQKMWIKTQSDFNLYDPESEKIERRPENYLQSLGLPAEGFITILKAKETFYFIYANAGVYVYEPSKKIRHITKSLPSDRLQNPVTSAVLDSKNYIWLLRYNGIIEKIDAEQDKTLLRTSIFQKENIHLQFGYAMFIDDQDEIWMYQRNTLSGLYQFTPSKNSLRHYSKESGSLVISSNAINAVAQDNKGFIWVITDHGGINIIDKERLTIRNLTTQENNRKSIADDALNAIYRDDLGIMWLGTAKKGINYFDENSNKFPLFQHAASEGFNIPFDDVNVFAEDKKGNLWIGTNGGGLIYFDRANKKFTEYKHHPSNNNSLCNDVVVSLCIDHEQKLWIGTYLGGMDCFDGKNFIHYRHIDSLPESIADDRVFSIYEDSNLNLWIGTLNFGLDRFDREKNVFYHHNTHVPQTMHSENITSIMEDSRGNLWIGTSWGIDVLDKSTSRFIHYISGNSKLSYNNVNGIFEDHAGNIWIATNRGLNVLPKGKADFKPFFIKDGLPDNTVLDILEDDDHYLWISTKSGISKIEIVNGADQELSIRCVNYNEYDGLQGREFNRFAAMKTRSGELIFGGSNGFNLFRPSELKNNNHVSPVVLTNFQLFNKSLNAGEQFNNHIILESSISETSEIVLRHNENDFSLEFAALEFTNTAKTRYAYMLEGFNKEWIPVNGKTRVATYTNIDPGNYVFIVKATNDDGTWNEKAVRLNISVLAPWWKTPAAYILYILFVAAVLYLLRKLIIRREKDRFILATERKEVQRMRELDLMKIKFFTNVSHEFRTPLSLILIPIEKFINQSNNAEQKNQFQLIQRNARRLLNMVNQLLDFRKMEVNELKLHAQEGDIIQFINEVTNSFTDLADKKNIRFNYSEHVHRLVMKFDHDKIERILFNLLSNAFKFTSEEGEVSVELRLLRQTGESFLQIQVKDSGIGIDSDKQSKIFDRFYQVSMPNTILNQGSGIGLAITREFAEMHGGSIKVDSAPGIGSCFTILLPVRTAADTVENLIPADAPELSEKEWEEQLSGLNGSEKPGIGQLKKPVILIVEDNDDFRFYLKDNLKEYFTIIEAVNGREGWKKILSTHPDLIVSDISMPLMNGIELCRKVKTDARTRHISVILLTALAGEQQQLMALETGPNDYITKPFNFEILFSKIKNLVEYQQVVKETYQKQLDVSPSDIENDLPEDDFIKKVLEIIENNMASSEFSVDNLRQELLLSRTSMYKKVLAVTGKTPIEFIRIIRLKRAAQLLEKTSHNVTEIAYMVGFNNPKYFARYFKDQFGILPSVYQSESRKKSISINGNSIL
jgi:signal transduction histidine kinase/ligand-binding sensor domain-containing protein/DNA-binding response OmpR family regulator